MGGLALMLLIASFQAPRVDPAAFYGIFGTLLVLFLTARAIQAWRKKRPPKLREPKVTLPPPPPPAPPQQPAAVITSRPAKPEPQLPPAHALPAFQTVVQLVPPMKPARSPSVEWAYSRLPEPLRRMIVRPS